MQFGPKFVTGSALVLAGLGSWLAASLAADVIEDKSGNAVAMALVEAGHGWAAVDTDGLQIHVSGTAPSEASRFNALHVAGTVVDSIRVIDGTDLEPDAPLSPPPYSIEILRNDEGITLIGLVPDTLDREAMANEIAALAEGAEVIDLLESASYPEPSNWAAAVGFGLNVLARLPRSKVSIAAGEVSVTAGSDSLAQKLDLEAALTRRVPDGVTFRPTITAPRPVISPFTLRFVIDESGARFDACSTDTPRGRDRILQAARSAGLDADADCRIGLGIPTPEWDNAAIRGIAAIAELGGGVITFSDADVTLVARQDTPQAVFDRVVGDLDSNLPAVFSLHSVLPRTQVVDEEDAGPPEFIATLSPEGQVQLRGRINNELVRDTVESFAKAHFGAGDVYTAARIDEELPGVWPTRVLAALQALSELENGAAIVREDSLEIRGATGNAQAEAEIAGMLAAKLGSGQTFDLAVQYEESLDPLAALPTPRECVDRANAILAATKITFEPGSTEIAGLAVSVVDQIAEVLNACHEVEMEIEIAGHTDSQGREEMNLDLSQQRADAVMNALIARRVLASKITSTGYGETTPIADNDTEDGREANRRIELRLIEAEDPADAGPEDAPDGAETAAMDGLEAGSDAGPDGEPAEAEGEAAEAGEDSSGGADAPAPEDPEATPMEPEEDQP